MVTVDITGRANRATSSGLRLAGWYSGRHVDVSSDIQSLEAEGYALSPSAIELLEPLRGLRSCPAREDGPNFLDGELFFVDAVGPAAGTRRKSWRSVRLSAVSRWLVAELFAGIHAAGRGSGLMRTPRSGASEAPPAKVWIAW